MTVKIGVIMGSTSDWPTMKLACDVLEQYGIDYEKSSLSTSNARSNV